MAPVAANERPPSASHRVLMTVELLESVLRVVDYRDFASCLAVSKLWKAVISQSSSLKQAFFLEAAPPSHVLIWRYRNGGPVRTPIRPPDLRPRVKISSQIRDLDTEHATWDRTVCDLHPSLEVQAAISSRTIVDIKFSADDMIQSTQGAWLHAYVTQPPCRMRDIYIQKFVDFRRSARRVKQYLDPDNNNLATLGRLRAALNTHREERALIMDRGGTIGNALRSFDCSKTLWIDGYVHAHAFLVKAAEHAFPDAVDPSEALPQFSQPKIVVTYTIEQSRAQTHTVSGA